MFDQIVLAVIMLGAINWGLIGCFRFNLISFSVSYLTDVHGFNRVIYVIIGLAALQKIFNRDYYLPFLGNAVFPCDSLEIKTPKNADIVTTVRTKPNVNVIFWSSETSNDIVVKNPWKAYDRYSNSGVALSNKDGVATLKIRNPSSYKVPSGYTLKPHVHYRICLGNGMLSKIKTVFLKL